MQRGSTLAAAGAGAVALALVAAGVVLSRAQREAEAAVGVAWLGAAYAAVAGFMLAPEASGEALLAEPLAYAGAGAALAGAIGLVGLGAGRTLVFPPLVVGVLALGAGLVVRGTDAAPADVLTVLLALVVMAGSVFPWIALGATGTRVDQLYTPADITADPDDIDPDRVASDARVAHEILLAISGTVGLLLVLAAPLAVSLGVAGTLLAVDACLIVMLRTRQYRTGSEVLLGLASGIAGLVAAAVAVLALHPDWRPALAGVLAAGGALVLAATLTPAVPSVRRGRFGDLLESTALLALLPLVVLAVGLFSAVREAVS